MKNNIHFWDIDHTIINNDCDFSWKKFLVFKKLAPKKESLKKASLFYEQYKKNCLNIKSFLEFQLKEFSGKSPKEMTLLAEEHFEIFIKDFIYKEASQIIQNQLKKGEIVCFITSTNEIIAKPIAKAFGIKFLLATKLELKNNLFSGEILVPYCLGKNKLIFMKKFCLARQLNFNQCAYYGDSDIDIEIFKKVKFPKVVNPSQKLRKIAQKNNWDIMSFHS